MEPYIPKSETEWRTKLEPTRYGVLRQKGTEPPFSSALLKNKETGMYTCAGCGAELFSSDAKFDSGTGWPSFTEAVRAHVELRPDPSHGMSRTEVLCKRCGGHLGHVFNDGPGSTGARFCINSLALNFKSAEGKKLTGTL